MLQDPAHAYLVLNDCDVLRLAEMAELAVIAETCFQAKAAGRLIGPPRQRVAFETGALVFTVGGLASEGHSSGIAGFRVYETFVGSAGQREQIVAVWNSSTGEFVGLIVGELLGALRTGAIGAVAVKHMAAPDAAVCAIIGSGKQAETQLMGAAAVRPSLKLARVFSRNPQSRERFAVRMSEKLALPVKPSVSAEEAMAGADIVLCATDSAMPVIDVGSLKSGAHINSVGPKLIQEHELPTEISDRTALVSTDSPLQVRSFGTAFFLHGTPAFDRIVDLADIVVGRTAVRNSNEDVTLFCSVGLAGTEVAIADAILSRARSIGALRPVPSDNLS